MNISGAFGEVPQKNGRDIILCTMGTNKELWENVLTELELELSRANFTTWFRDTHITRVDDGVVYIGVPNQFVRDWLSSKYHKNILRSLRGLDGSVRNAEYVVSRGAPKRQSEEIPKRESAFSELPLESVHMQTGLNPRYTFDSFVVGSFNELAHAAAQAVIRKPGIAYNPLFIYGETGLGKTHLIQSIGNYFRGVAPERKVFYVTSEKFAIDYVSALQANKVNSFKEKYRQYDLLIMDDIQFLSRKEKTQEELFHLFNTLYDNNKQIVFSSDQHPNLIQNLEERLKSRFNAGMIVSIIPPDHESRVAILRAKAAREHFLIADEIIEHIAATLQGNIRELEGALNTLLCQSQLKGRELTLNDAKNLLRDIGTPKKAVSVKEVIKTISDYYGVDESSIYEKTRRKEVVKPRQVIMFILREDFRISFPTIGEKLGGRDHTTVIHSCEKIRGDLKVDSVLNQEVNQIRLMLK